MDNELLTQMQNTKKLFEDNREYFQKCALIIVASGDRETLVTEALTDAGIAYVGTDVCYDPEAFSEDLPRVHIHVLDEPFKFEYGGPGIRGYRIPGTTTLNWMPYCPTLPAFVTQVYCQLYTCEDDASETRMFRVLRDRTGDLVQYKPLDAITDYLALPEIARFQAADDAAQEPA